MVEGLKTNFKPFHFQRSSSILFEMIRFTQMTQLQNLGLQKDEAPLMNVFSWLLGIIGKCHILAIGSSP